MCYWRVEVLGTFSYHTLDFDNCDSGVDDDVDDDDADDDDNDDDDESWPVWRGKLDRGWEALPQSRLLEEALQILSG